ncbi:MAG: hypothetical protein IT186_15615 [Acidobacteria bacterium]|nr:hypothetical protein [Acidobacteriota bacterium]
MLVATDETIGFDGGSLLTVVWSLSISAIENPDTVNESIVVSSRADASLTTESPKLPALWGVSKHAPSLFQPALPPARVSSLAFQPVSSPSSLSRESNSRRKLLPSERSLAAGSVPLRS